ncbi:MAG TPA: Type 1 glutamine amidotransferase-like domain-containing protein, partial [Candidatus Limnocylindrales bacterium]
MPGLVALVGAGEFLPAMAEFDLGLLAATGRPRPRVALLPTASYPDGEAAFQRWAAMGTEHFTALGAEVEPVLVRDRAAADDAGSAQAVGEADLVYLSTGRPGYLGKVLDGTAVERALVDAHDRGMIVAGCSAGAIVLGARRFEFRRKFLPWPLRWRPGLGFVPNVAVIPNYNAWPEPLVALMALQAPRGGAVLGIDEGTAIVGRDGAWQVHGDARVT